MRIVAISDTHNLLDKVNIPEGDLLLHAGDATMRGSAKEWAKFNEDLGRIKDKFKYGIVAIPGNHDFDLSFGKSIITNAKLAFEEEINVNGLRIWADSYCTIFGNWAYMLPREELKKKRALIPEGLDILLCHNPPYGILDVVDYNWSLRNVGCEELRDAIELKKPKVVVCGHLHEAHGTFKSNDIYYINAAICNDDYNIAFEPIVFELN